MIKTIFTWDLGATKCSAGLVEYNKDSQNLECKKQSCVKLTETSSLEDLIECLENKLNSSMSEADAICIGAAGHFDGESLLLENAYPYDMPFAKLAKLRAWPAFSVIHDYAPIVCATFTSYMENANNIKRLNINPLKKHGRRVAFGIGTGLGLKDGVLFENGDFWLGQNEVGHIGITSPPLADHYRTQRHEELIRFLHEKTGIHKNQALTYEKILSGLGTVRLHEFFYGEDPEITPEEVGMRMCRGEVNEMMDAFAWYVGLFVGTVQLLFMPEGGVWITGGVALKNLDLFDRADFLAGIHASPAYKAQREYYPLGVLCNHEHALIGCGYYASRRLL